MNLTKHFTLEELTASQTAAREGIDNQPPIEQLQKLARLCTTMETVRQNLGDNRILTSSGYRSPVLNAMVAGSSKTSDHMDGRAIDFTCPQYGTPLEVCRRVAAMGIDFEQIIYEYRSWCHFSIPPAGRAGKRETLTKHDKASPYVAGFVE